MIPFWHHNFEDKDPLKVNQFKVIGNDRSINATDRKFMIGDLEVERGRAVRSLLVKAVGPIEQSHLFVSFVFSFCWRARVLIRRVDQYAENPLIQTLRTRRSRLRANKGSRWSVLRDVTLIRMRQHGEITGACSGAPRGRHLYRTGDGVSVCDYPQSILGGLDNQ